MVADPRTPSRPDQLRAVGDPQPASSRPATGQPGGSRRGTSPLRSVDSPERQLRQLNLPEPIRVAGQRPDGHPAAIIEGRSARRIVAVTDEWWVEDEWWRDPTSRHYLEVQLADGTVRTIYHDTVADQWHRQAY